MGKSERGVSPLVPKKWNGILIVGECPTKADMSSGKPFRSNSGVELTRYLSGAGIVFKECAMMYVQQHPGKQGDLSYHYKKPKRDVTNGTAVEFKPGYNITTELAERISETRKYIDQLQPKFIIALGEGALMAVCNERGIDNFRGSMETYRNESTCIPVLPTHSTSRIFKQPQLRFLVSSDLARVAQHIETGWPEPPWDVVINPTFDQAYEYLHDILTRMDGGEKVKLGVDIETRRRFYIGTIGFAHSDRAGLCIPIITPDWEAYWTDAQREFVLVSLVKQVLEHPNVMVAGQNYHYDAQYLARHWGIRSHIWCDTMIAHHVVFSGDIPKALHVISSIYCDYHKYWKDESHSEEDDKWEPTWDNWDSYQLYNVKDCCKTLDAAEVILRDAIDCEELQRAYDFQMDMWPNLLKCMLRGNYYDWDERNRQMKMLEEQMAALQAWMLRVVPEEIYPLDPKKAAWWASTQQLCELFYEVLNQPVVTTKRGPGVYTQTTDDEALKVIMTREPILKPLCLAILLHRSMVVFYSTFLKPKPDYDGYMRSMYKLPGTTTYRLASSGDVFDFGLNLQNLPKGDG